MARALLANQNNASRIHRDGSPHAATSCKPIIGQLLCNSYYLIGNKLIVKDDAARLSDLAEMILAVGRLIQLLGDQSIGTGTPIEISVLRFINRNPGTTARAASEATLLPSSNFSRVLRGLEERGLVTRKADANDARRVSLYPTALARKTREKLGVDWYRLLRGIEDDPAKIDNLIVTLKRIESELVERRRPEGTRREGQA